MKPPISYYGGKQRLARKICELIPPHRIYVEPYAGGAAVFFRKPERADKKYIEVLNDADHRLINFYRVLQHPVKAYRLYTRLLFTPYSRQMHREAQDCNDGVSGDDIEQAYNYFLDIMCSFSHCLGGGWKRSFASNLRSPDVVRNRIKLLESYVGRLQSVFIECRDALDIIDIWDSPDTFFYVDPPYPGADQGHYRGFTSEQFSTLVQRLDNIQGSFLLSNYPQPGMPEHWERFELSATMSAHREKREQRSEIVWRKLSQAANESKAGAPQPRCGERPKS